MDYIIWSKEEGIIRVLRGSLNLEYALEFSNSNGYELTEYAYPVYPPVLEYYVSCGKLLVKFTDCSISD